ncbi:MAG: hypothetical protein P0S95_07835 [Rhabdochlamydiaceae bacterium]|nr:hypothetical protein [Candidatus Amphrikana amoebophyrae]
MAAPIDQKYDLAHALQLERSWTKTMQEVYENPEDSLKGKVVGAVASVATSVMRWYDPSWYKSVETYREPAKIRKAQAREEFIEECKTLRRDLAIERRNGAKKIEELIASFKKEVPELGERYEALFRPLIEESAARDEEILASSIYDDL